MSNKSAEHKDGATPHHFESRRQHSESNKLGMWLFLCTEIMMFGGLFCGYAVYRANHPEIFAYAHQFLDTTLGGINTLVLITSSFTMAMAVRAAQLSQKKLLIWMLIVTFACACGFMGIKGVEYNAKWKHGLLWGKKYKPVQHAEKHEKAAEPGKETGAATAAAPATSTGTATSTATGTATGPMMVRTAIPPAATGPEGLVSGAKEESHDVAPPENAQIFFGIYFVMTGLHGIHVLVGMGLMLWLTGLAAGGHLHSENYMPVDMVGLYWHLVDLIWIFLFPLLYLIH